MKSDDLFKDVRTMIGYVEQDIKEIISNHIKFQAETLNDLIPFERIVVIGYTPTFNDGEECVHTTEIGYKHFSKCKIGDRLSYPSCLDFDGVFREVCGEELATKFQCGYSYAQYLKENDKVDVIFDSDIPELNQIWLLLTNCISETLRIGVGTNHKAIVDVVDGDVTCTIHKIDPDEWYNETTACI